MQTAIGLKEGKKIDTTRLERSKARDADNLRRNREVLRHRVGDNFQQMDALLLHSVDAKLLQKVHWQQINMGKRHS